MYINAEYHHNILKLVWDWEDSNLQSQKRADLQSARLPITGYNPESTQQRPWFPHLNMTNLYAVGIHISKIHILGLANRVLFIDRLIIIYPIVCLHIFEDFFEFFIRQPFIFVFHYIFLLLNSLKYSSEYTLHKSLYFFGIG